MNNWNFTDKNKFPPQGEEVVVSDGRIYDIAWYNHNEHKWIKAVKGGMIIFDYFEPIMWKPVWYRKPSEAYISPKKVKGISFIKRREKMPISSLK